MSIRTIVCTRYRFTREAAARSRCLRLFLILATLGLAQADAATMKFRAVRVNNVPITPTATPVVAPGDVIEVDLLASGWGTEIDSLTTYQASIDNGSLLLGGNSGSVLPLHFNSTESNSVYLTNLRSAALFINAAPARGVCSAASQDPGASCVANGADCLAPACVEGSRRGLSCVDNADCPGGTCVPGTCIDGVCVGGSNGSHACAEPANHCVGGSCDTRPDWVFAEASGLVVTAAAADVFSIFPAYRLGATIFVGNVGTIDPSACVGGSNDGRPCDGADDCPGGSCHVVDFYMGTLILVASDDAEGEFVLNYLPQPYSFLSEPPLDALLRLEPLTITVRTPEPPPDNGGGFEPIPTVSTWGLAALALMLMIGAKLYFRRGRWNAPA